MSTQNPIDFLKELADRLQTQDNLYTASPNYCIQENVLICGIDEDYGATVGWFAEEARYPEDKNSRKHRALERYYDKHGREPDGWTRCGYEFKWRHTGISFLTHTAAHDYVTNNKHRHEYDIRVYVDSHYRNSEMREVRRLLSGPVFECIAALRDVTAELTQLHAHHYGACEGGCPAETYIRAAEAAMEGLKTHREPHQ